jgi:predicted transposase YbfD/YdcC
MTSKLLCKVYEHFENVTDPRVNRGENYPLLEMILVALCASICDCNTWTDVERFGNARLAWLRKFLPFEQGIPTDGTFGRVFARLDTFQFYAALQSWASDIAHTLRGHTVALDGKTLRGSHDLSRSKSALHSVSAWVCGLKMCVGLKSVEDKSNEIPAVQALIDMLDLQGAVVTVDAMHTQVETADKIVAKEADYIMIAKGNQPALEAEVRHTMLQAMEAESPQLRECEHTETNRGRLETRIVTALPVPRASKVFKRWPGLKTVGCIFRRTESKGKLEESQEFFITSLPCRVQRIAKHIRSHWSIESSQHHVLDVTFTEDASRIRKGNGPEISSVFRRLALNILQQDTTVKDNIRGKRKRCSLSEATLERLMACFCEN